MFKINRSVFRRLLFYYLLTVMLGLGVVGFSMSFFVNEYIYDAKKEELLRKAKKVNLAIQNDKDMTDNSKKVILFLDQLFDVRIWVFDRSGKIIATSTQEEVAIGKSVDNRIVYRVLKGESVVGEDSFEGMDEPTISSAVTWGKDREVYGGIVVHAPTQEITRTISNIRETIIWATALGVIFSTVTVSYLSWTISRPLSEIDRVAARIGMGDYSARLRLNDLDEIGELAQTINSLAEKLERMDLERKRQDQTRNDFLANVSHELRTPLTAMQGFIEALQDGLISDEDRYKYYDVMYRETAHLNRLIDDLMDLTRLENKEISLNKYPLEVESVLCKAALKFQHEAQDKGITIEVDTEPNLPKLYVDMDRFEQIVDNLVKNAVKFTEQGVITLWAEREGDELLLKVSDTGVGISEEDQKWIWERFFKVDRGRSRRNKGTGLGLAIVKELVELHQGRVTVESKLGEGATFKVWMPWGQT